MELGTVSLLEEAASWSLAHAGCQECDFSGDEDCVDCQTDNDHTDNKC